MDGFTWNLQGRSETKQDTIVDILGMLRLTTWAQFFSGRIRICKHNTEQRMNGFSLNLLDSSEMIKNNWEHFGDVDFNPSDTGCFISILGGLGVSVSVTIIMEQQMNEFSLNLDTLDTRFIFQGKFMGEIISLHPTWTYFHEIFRSGPTWHKRR